MPQELRWPQYRTKDYQPESAKILQTRQMLSFPSINTNSVLTQKAIELVWGDMTNEELEALLNGMALLDTMAVEEQEEVKIGR